MINAKLLLSGTTVGSVVLSPFSGGEYAAAIAALGGVYVLRRQGGKNEESKEN